MIVADFRYTVLRFRIAFFCTSCLLRIFALENRTINYKIKKEWVVFSVQSQWLNA